MEKIIKGYVLKVVPYQESNLIVTLLTKEGIDIFKARGVLKPTSKNAPSCQLYTYGEYTLSYKQDGANKTLTSGVVLSMIPSLYTDLKVSTLLGLLAETITKNDDFLDGYNVFEVVFNHLKEGNCNYATIIAIVLKLNAMESGIPLDADSCVRCGSKKNIYTVSYDDGGLLCAKCAYDLHKLDRTVSYIQNFRYVVKANIRNINDFSLDLVVAKNLIIDLFDYLEKNAGIYFKSRQMVLQLV